MAYSGGKAISAVFSEISTNAGVIALVPKARIYSGKARAGAAFPYIVIDGITSDKRFNPKDVTIQTHRVRIYAFSRENGSLEITNIKGAIFDALEKQTLTVSGASFIDCQQEGLDDAVLMPNGKTWRGIVEFAVTIQ